MTLTDRDRKIVLVLVPLVAILGYWFLVLGPKRNEASSLGATLSEAESKRDTAQETATQLEGSKGSYAKDYETVVRLGKAIPATLDMPSLLVQLEDAADGTGIRFSSVRAGDRSQAPAPPAPSPSGGQGGDAAAGGEQASTGAGKATEKANEAAGTSDSANAAAGADPATAGSTSGAPGLDSVPLEFSFSGSFFDLADFFHEMKRFVRVANRRIRVQGRLMTIDTLNFKSDKFPVIDAKVNATVYLSPKSQGTTAGASPDGPATTPAATPSTSPAPAPSSAPVAQSGDAAR